MFKFQNISLWWANLGMPPIKSTAATYTERTIRKKSFLNNLLYNSWKHFQIHSKILFSVWSFISNNFPPKKFSKIPLSPSFSSSLDFEKFQFPRFYSVQKSSPPLHIQGQRYEHANFSNGGLFWKFLVLFFRRIYALSVGFKMKTWWKSIFEC